MVKRDRRHAACTPQHNIPGNKAGVYTALNSDLTQEERYSPDIADDKYRENLKSKGGVLKIGNDIKLANYIEDKIVNEDIARLPFWGA